MRGTHPRVGRCPERHRFTRGYTPAPRWGGESVRGRPHWDRREFARRFGRFVRTCGGFGGDFGRFGGTCGGFGGTFAKFGEECPRFVGTLGEFVGEFGKFVGTFAKFHGTFGKFGAVCARSGDSAPPGGILLGGQEGRRREVSGERGIGNWESGRAANRGEGHMSKGPKGQRSGQWRLGIGPQGQGIRHPASGTRSGCWGHKVLGVHVHVHIHVHVHVHVHIHVHVRVREPSKGRSFGPMTLTE